MVPSLRARRGENAGDEFAAGRPHEAFELRRELLSHLLSIEYEPNHANDEQYERCEGQGCVVGERGGQPQAVVLPPVLDGTEGDVPEGCDRHGSSLLHKVAPIDHACIVSYLGISKAVKVASSLQLRIENRHGI